MKKYFRVSIVLSEWVETRQKKWDLRVFLRLYYNNV